MGHGVRVWLGCGALAIVLAYSAGCSVLGGNRQLLNYAHRDNGATIASSGHDGSRGADSLINGVVAPAAWSGGEGWAYTFERTERRRREGPGLHETISIGGVELDSVPDAGPDEHTRELEQTGVVLRLHLVPRLDSPVFR